VKTKVLKEHVITHKKCETRHLWQWKQKFFKCHHENLYIPFQGKIIKGVSIESMGQPHMQWDKPRVIWWGLGFSV
jgi:hypothetical protein